jgi:uncharacterized protein YfdQ (DUF2303 family)
MSSDTVTDNVQTILNAGAAGANVGTRILQIGFPGNPITIPVALGVDGDGAERVEVLDEVITALDKREPFDRMRENLATLSEVDSLIAYVKRYGSERTIVYANTAVFEFTAVLDDHPEGPAGSTADKAGWRAHRARYTCPRSPEWLAWTGKDGKAMRQTEFADFLESRLEDLVSAENMPKAVEVLAVARSLNIKTKGQFSREMNPTNGDYILINKQETTSDSTQIPRAFAIGVPVFEGGARYQVECRIRFSIAEGVPAFSYTMHRRAEIERDAFNEVRAKIGTDTGRLILAGAP